LLNPTMADRMIRSKNLKLFEKLIKENVEPMLVASTLEDTLIMLRREGVEPSEEMILELFESYKKDEFVKAAIPDILRLMVKGKTVSKALDEGQLKKITGKELKKIVDENKGDMGKIMAKYRLRVDAAEVAILIKKK
ncbi:hypothetical protein KJ780_01585, partial [Candidatus Micrarchaeota archaeon]|nr:hypothetical protein [Candidatus Micrarchaeota archaeon]